MSSRRWTHNRGGRAGAFSSRLQGYGKAQHAWICTACRAWHETRPKECGHKACTSGLFWHFDSKVEGFRYAALLMQQDHGLIESGTLVHHKRYPLCAPHPRGLAPVEFAYYEADSSYTLASGVRVVEDVKPRAEQAQDPLFVHKRKHFEAQYGITLTIIS